MVIPFVHNHMQGRAKDPIFQNDNTCLTLRLPNNVKVKRTREEAQLHAMLTMLVGDGAAKPSRKPSGPQATEVPRKATKPTPKDTAQPPVPAAPPTSKSEVSRPPMAALDAHAPAAPVVTPPSTPLVTPTETNNNRDVDTAIPAAFYTPVTATSNKSHMTAFNKIHIDFTQLDATLERNHMKHTLSAKSNNCWWRSALVSVLNSVPHEKIQQKVQRLLPNKPSTATLLAALAQYTQTHGINTVLTQSLPVHHAEMPSQIRCPHEPADAPLEEHLSTQAETELADAVEDLLHIQADEYASPEHYKSAVTEAVKGREQGVDDFIATLVTQLGGTAVIVKHDEQSPQVCIYQSADDDTPSQHFDASTQDGMQQQLAAFIQDKPVISTYGTHFNVHLPHQQASPSL